MGTLGFILMETSNEECEPAPQEPTTVLSAPCYSQESTHNYVKDGETPHTKSCLPSASQNGVAKCTRGVSAMGEQLSHLEIQKSWQFQKEQLEKELYECTRAHKMSIVQNAYGMSKLQVSFGLVKRQESLAREQLEDALDLVIKLQAKVERLNGQLRRTENENRRLSTAVSTLSCELEKQTAENESLRTALEAAKSVESVDVVKGLTEETAPLIAQHELQTQQLQEIENNMATGVRSVLQGWTVENEARHFAASELQELKQKLEDRERLQEDVTSNKLGLEKITKEKEELLMQLEAATKELQESKKRMAEAEMHDVELGRYGQVIDGLNLEKITLMGQLEMLIGELEKQKEVARKAQIEGNKAMEAERECARALKLVEEKEEEMEYYIRQLETLREKNGMLRTQLDMEQQCKEVEMAAMLTVHDQSITLLNRNLNTAMELVASNGVQSPQNIPLEPPSLRASQEIPAALEKHTSSDDDTRQEPLQDTSRGRKGRPTTETPNEVLNSREAGAVQQSTRLPMRKSLRMRNRTNTQPLTDSGSVSSGASRQVVDLTEKDNDADDGAIEDDTQPRKRGSTRVKRPPVPLPNGTETSKKRGRKKSSNMEKSGVNETDTDETQTEDRDGRAKKLLIAASIPDVRVASNSRTPSRPSITPRSASRLPR